MNRELKINKGKKHILLCDICHKINKGYKLKDLIEDDELQYYKIIYDNNNYCLIKNKDNLIELCFKSTANARDLSTSLNSNLTTYDELNWYSHKPNLVDDVKIHRGYKRFWRGLRHHVMKYLDEYLHVPIHITGHSMGGAIAILSAYDLKLNNYEIKEITTFGAPKIGNSKFVENYNILLTNKTIQFQMVFDPITIFPIKRYSHVEKKFKIKGLGHSFERYYKFFYI